MLLLTAASWASLVEPKLRHCLTHGNRGQAVVDSASQAREVTTLAQTQVLHLDLKWSSPNAVLRGVASYTGIQSSLHWSKRGIALWCSSELPTYIKTKSYLSS